MYNTCDWSASVLPTFVFMRFAGSLFFFRLVIRTQDMKQIAIIFSKLEKFFKIKYPIFIKNCLVETGYDTAAALKTIEKTSIGKLEKIISERPELVKDTIYVDESGNLKIYPFKFKIGHESLILSIPKDLNDFLSTKKIEKSKQNISAEDDLKLALIERIAKYSEKKNKKITLEFEHLLNFSNHNNVVKCMVKCPFCENKFTCTFNTCWRASNFCKHIVTCAEKNAALAPTQTEIEPRIERATPSYVLLEVENVVLR